MATTTFNDLITFSRGSNATLVGPNGLIQWAPANLLTNSQDFEATAWSKVNVTATANAVVAPDGSTTADTVAATANGQAYIRQNATVIATATYTTSIYLRAGTVSWCLLEIWNSGVTKWSGRYINLSNGTLGGSTSGGGGLGGVFTVTNVGSGWYRVAVTAASDNTVLTPALYVADGDGDITVLAGNNITMWGAQLELGSTATAYNNTSVRNLLGFSEAFDNAAWVKDRASIVTGAQANPVNGLFNAQKLMEDTTASNSHRVRQTVNLGSAPITFSAYLKAAERTWAYLRIDDASSTKFAYFNLATGAVGFATSGLTSSITSVGNGWYRCSTTFAAPAASASGSFVIGLATGDTINSYTGDGSSGVFIYGAQLSNSASLDPYVPTPGAAPSSTAYYGPRLDYDPVTLQPKGLLVEEARTNLLLQSNAFTTSPWSSQGSPVLTATAATAPDGTTSAWLWARTSTAFAFTTQLVVKAASAITYTTSYFVKKSIGDYFAVRLQGLFPAVADAVFDMVTGTVFAVRAVNGFTGGSAAITPAGNGWYRVSLTATSDTDTSIQSVVSFNSNGGWINGVDSAPNSAGYLWGAQLEAGAFATSYIPTIASTVTRSADVATISGSLFSQWYNQPEGTLVAEVQKFTPSATSTYTYELLGSTSSFSMRVRLGADGRMQSVDGGAVQVDTQIQSSVPTTSSKYGVAYAANNYAGSANGGAVGTDTSATVPAITSLALGSAAVVNLYIRSIRYYPVRAADFQLQQLTS